MNQTELLSIKNSLPINDELIQHFQTRWEKNYLFRNSSS